MVRRSMFLAASLLLAVVGYPTIASGVDGDRSTPVVLVHGYAAATDDQCPQTNAVGNWGDGNVNNGTNGDMIGRLKEWGWTGSFHAVAYYGCDVGYDHWINHHGSHNRHHDYNGSDRPGAPSHNGSGHTRNTSIRHLGYHLAWYIYDHFKIDGQCVDVAAHSMGGNIIRYAVAQTENGNPDFPRSLCVQDVITLGTPHSGANEFGTLVCQTRQCDEMEPGSEFQTWLRNNAWSPDNAGGTDWTVVGAEDDIAVASFYAIDMGAEHKVVYLENAEVSHSDYMQLTGPNENSQLKWKNTPAEWSHVGRQFWPVKWSDMALARENW